MKFGIFLAPFHAVLGQSPTLALERDLELIVALDRFGFDEAWIGEHHSGGVETIASPEVFIAVAAERTKHIKLGTGVSSIPYHHPLMLADRMVLLDHLTRGRVMLGCGPGQLTSDALMMGIPPDTQRPRLEEGLDAIMQLLTSTEPVTIHTDWFTLDDARLQLAPYTRPHFPIAVAASISPSGPSTAGRHGVGLLSVAATSKAGFDLLGTHWDVLEENAKANGKVADRSRWRLVAPMHIAETKEQARKDVEHGIVEFARYFRHILPFGPVGAGETTAEILESVEREGFALVGTPDDAIERIKELEEQSNGGFGTFLMFGHEWADREATLRSYELMARDVMPHFQDSLRAPLGSADWIAGSGGKFSDAAGHAINKAIEEYRKPG
jgi:limonene 1,2-monooxygenase